MYYGSLYWVSTAATDNDGTNYSKCAGTTNGMENYGFSAEGNNRLVCNVDGTYLINCTFSASCSGATEATFALHRNDGLIDGTEINRSIGTGGDNGAGATSAIQTFKKGEYVELWCKSNNAADNITIASGVLSTLKVN